MAKQKKNRSLWLASVILCFTMLSFCLSSYTFAKYTTAFEGYDTARVALLDFNADLTTEDENGNTLTAGATLGQTATMIDIFKSAYSSADTTLAGQGASDITVKSASGDKVIAPGTFGSFYFDLSGTSEVSLKIGIDIKEIGPAPILMLYEYDGKYYSDIYYHQSVLHVVLHNDGTTITPAVIGGTLSDLADAVAAKIGIIDAGTAISVSASDLTVKWHWPYEVYLNPMMLDASNDLYDTALGSAGTSTFTLQIAATATQVD